MDDAHVDPLQPPSDVHLADINSTHLTFHWNLILITCNAIQYHIESANCGHCPNVTSSTSATCYYNRSGLFTMNQLCMFTVQTVVCDNIVGNDSKTIQVTFKK